MSEYRTCRYCIHAIYIPVERKVMCNYEGFISCDAVCSRFTLDPFKIKLNRPRNFDFSKYEKEDYSID